MERPENETGAVNEEEMIAFFMAIWIARGRFDVHRKFKQRTAKRTGLSRWRHRRNSREPYEFVIDFPLKSRICTHIS